MASPRHEPLYVMGRPKVLDQNPKIPAADYAQEMQACPRSKHWMSKWLER
jgi:hypothetical protein